jgi:hypothetical protein
MPDVKPDNPAGRLYLLLDQTKRVPNPNTSAYTIGHLMNTAWDIPAGDHVSLFKFILTVVETLDEAEEQLKNADADQYAIFQDTAQNLRRVFVQIAINSNWQQVVGQIREHDMVTLRFASVTLSRKLNELVIPNDELKAVREKLEGLYTFIEDCEIDFSLKILLLDSVQSD